MAERRYGHGRGEGWRGREDSIFSDDDRRERGSGRWSSEHGRDEERGFFGRGGRDDERGFFERAGDEVRSWFGDDEAERRRELDMSREDARSAFSSAEYDRRYGDRASYGPGGFGAHDRGWDDEDRARRGGARRDLEDRDFGQGGFGGYGRSDYGGRSGFVGRSQWDDDYRRWRERQIAQFDREYDEYRRERQEKFDREFDSWRSSRLTEGGFGAGGSGSVSGNAGATTAGGGGKASARASTGSTGAAETTRGGEAEAQPRRSGRSRS